MSSYTILPAATVDFVKAPTIALAGETGSGKTESAMRLARGYVGQHGKFLVIDTEEKRALYKKGRYDFDWMDLQPPFTPATYLGALEAAKGYQAVIVDSGSHEYAGEGGMQDMQAEDLERMSKGDFDKMQRLTAPAWKRPKLEHKKLMARIIRYPTLLIFCLRAEPKIKFVKDAQNKTQIVDAGYLPICEKMFMYEMLVGALMHADNPGVPVHLKKLEPDLEPVFLTGEQIDETTGGRLAQWASSRRVQTAAPRPEQAKSELLNADQVTVLKDALKENGKSEAKLLRNVSKQYGTSVESLSQIRSADYQDALAYARGQ